MFNEKEWYEIMFRLVFIALGVMHIWHSLWGMVGGKAKMRCWMEGVGGCQVFCTSSLYFFF